MQVERGDNAIKEYRQIGVGNTLQDVTPQKLIQLMMEHALTKIYVASGHIERGEVAEKGAAIGSAIDIISGLQASLNHKADTAMSENFDALYAYMMRRLLDANLHDDRSALHEVAGLMRELKEAWDAIVDDPTVAEAEVVQ